MGTFLSSLVNVACVCVCDIRRRGNAPHHPNHCRRTQQHLRTWGRCDCVVVVCGAVPPPVRDVLVLHSSVLQNVKPKEICSVTLDAEDAEKFTYAVANQYWYEIWVDMIQAWGMVGEIVVPEDGSAGEEAFIFTHKTFSFGYNGNQIVEVNLTAENPEPIVEGGEIVFTYAVEWIPSDVPFDDRYERYLDKEFFEHSIHLFSILNSFMMVVFLVGLVFMILMRTLKRDFARYNREEEDDISIGDDSGWKMIYGDVFRTPPNISTLAALLGTGAQLLVMALFLLVITMTRSVYHCRGQLVTFAIFFYAFTNIVSGYVSGAYCKAWGGVHWKRTLMLTAAGFPTLVFLLTFVLNSVAVSYNSISAQPFSSVAAVVLIWAFIAFPLTLVGTLFGRSLSGSEDVPFKPKRVPRHIPERA